MALFQNDSGGNLYKIKILHIAILCVVPTELTWMSLFTQPRTEVRGYTIGRSYGNSR
jgi:hypothetical protein